MERLEQQEAEALAAKAAADAELEQAKAELSDCERHISYWGARERKLQNAAEILDDLGNEALRGALRGFSPYDVNRIAFLCRGQLEELEKKRGERDRLRAAVERLSGK